MRWASKNRGPDLAHGSWRLIGGLAAVSSARGGRRSPVVGATRWRYQTERDGSVLREVHRLRSILAKWCIGRTARRNSDLFTVAAAGVYDRPAPMSRFGGEYLVVEPGDAAVEAPAIRQSESEPSCCVREVTWMPPAQDDRNEKHQEPIDQPRRCQLGAGGRARATSASVAEASAFQATRCFPTTSSRTTGRPGLSRLQRARCHETVVWSRRPRRNAPHPRWSSGAPGSR